MTIPKMKACAAVAMAAALIGAVGVVAPAYGLTDVPTSPDGSIALADQQTTGANAANSMPGNPNAELPSAVSNKIPDSAAVVSEDLAVTETGEIKNVITGKTVTDPKLVGTKNKPADPLAKTDGDSFIPVEASEVKQAVSSANESAKAEQSASKTAAKVQTIALENNQYGAYWGTYNNAPAFFNYTGEVFAQNAKGVIDVSEWNGIIDWAAAKQGGVEGAIIRAGYGVGNVDHQAARNISECKRLGIPFGVYWYSYAYDAEFASQEGSSLASTLQLLGVSNGDLAYPAFYDLEQWAWTGHTTPSTPAQYDEIVNAWYASMGANGYSNLSVYSYTNYLNGPLNSSNIHARTSWVAQYSGYMGFTDWFGTSRGWQYTSTGSVPGIAGSTDLNAFGTSNGSSTGVTPAGKVRVFRLYNEKYNDHIITADGNEYLTLMVDYGWKGEGVAFLTDAPGTADSVKVYRLYNSNVNDHLFTKDEAEYDALRKAGWSDEGVAFYAPTNGTVKVHRLYDNYSRRHHFTADENEYTTLKARNWGDEGVTFTAYAA